MLSQGTPWVCLLPLCCACCRWFKDKTHTTFLSVTRSVSQRTGLDGILSTASRIYGNDNLAWFAEGNSALHATTTFTQLLEVAADTKLQQAENIYSKQNHNTQTHPSARIATALHHDKKSSMRTVQTHQSARNVRRHGGQQHQTCAAI